MPKKNEKDFSSTQATAGKSSVRGEFPTGACRDTLYVRFDLICPMAELSLASACAEGATKYGDQNWTKGIPNSNLLNHAINHLMAYRLDMTAEDHLAHAFWNIMALIHNDAQCQCHEVWEKHNQLPTTEE